MDVYNPRVRPMWKLGLEKPKENRRFKSKNYLPEVPNSVKSSANVIRPRCLCILPNLASRCKGTTVHRLPTVTLHRSFRDWLKLQDMQTFGSVGDINVLIVREHPLCTP